MDAGYLYFIDDTYYNDFNHKDLKPNKTIDANGICLSFMRLQH